MKLMNNCSDLVKLFGIIFYMKYKCNKLQMLGVDTFNLGTTY